MVLERGYELAEEAFDFADGISSTLEPDFMYGEDKERGYTEYQSTFHIDEQFVI